MLASAMLTLECRPTVIPAASGTQAMGVMGADRELGLSLPADPSVVECSDIETRECIGLVTVRQPLEESGRIAAEVVFDAIGTPDRGSVRAQLPLGFAVCPFPGDP
jgi:DNA-binding LacI/PurR family transcriptional regulator